MNGPLTGLERMLERIAERPLARILPVAAPPEEIVRRLERAARDAARARGAGGTAPARWEVAVPPGTPSAADPVRAGAAFAEELRRRARRRGLRFAALPAVSVIVDPALPRSGLRIRPLPDAATDAGDAPPIAGWADAPPAPTSADVAPVAARATLAVTVPGMPPGRVPIGAAALRIGRGRDCEVRLPDAALSRLHGRIAWQQGVLVYTDLDSRNGSLLNGRPIRTAALGAGDRLVLGTSVLDVEGPEPA